MMSEAYIREIQAEAAASAAADERQPLRVWPGDGFAELRHAPFLGGYVPDNWEELSVADVVRDWDWFDNTRGMELGTLHKLQSYDTLFVDSSGFGVPSEPSLTGAELTKAVHAIREYMLEVGVSGFGIGIYEAGQFQVNMALYVEQGSNWPFPKDFPKEDWG